MKPLQPKARWSMFGLAAAGVLVFFAFGVPETSGCGGPSDLATGTDDLTATVCATQHTGTTHDGESVIICDATYPALPRVRPPADVRPAKGSATLYLAADPHGRFIDRDGVEYAAVDSKGIALPDTKLPSAMHMPSNRNLIYIYQVTAEVGTYTEPYGHTKQPSLQISALKPYILLSQKAIDGAVTVWEGTVSKRISPSAFDPKVQVPIRISITSMASARGIPIWDNVNKALPDGPVQALVGTVENFSKAVKGSDGKCIPALSSLGSGNPFEGAHSGAMQMYRMATMHFPGDQVLVLEYPSGTTGLSSNGMGGMTILHPAGLIQTAKDPSWGAQQINPHAAPNGHVMHLHPATGGGGGC